jgi:dTDP-4-dehydrorhamnose reductase
LLTGSNGLLGQKLLKELLGRENLTVIATSKSLDRIDYLSGYQYESMDITNGTELNYILQKWKPEVVINTAAITQVDYCQRNRTECWNTNAKAVEYLANACNAIDAHFVQMSTDFVFDGIGGPYREDDETSPLSFYGQSKLEGERMTLQIANSYSIVRTILVYGFLPSMSRSNIVLWVKNKLENGEAIQVINDQYRMPTLAEDLAWATAEIAEKRKNGIWHISGDELFSILEIARHAARFYNLDQSLMSPISSLELNEIAKRPPSTGFDLFKAKTELNYKPHSLQDGMRILADQMAKA